MYRHIIFFKSMKFIYMLIIMGALGYFIASLFTGYVDIGSFSDYADGIYHLID